MAIEQSDSMIQIPNEQRHLSFPFSYLFACNKLGDLIEKLENKYGRIKVVTPDAVAKIRLILNDDDNGSLERYSESVLIELGLLAQIINFLVGTGIEKYQTNPKNASHGYASAVVRTGLCSDVLVEAYHMAELVRVNGDPCNSSILITPVKKNFGKNRIKEFGFRNNKVPKMFIVFGEDF